MKKGLSKIITLSLLAVFIALLAAGCFGGKTVEVPANKIELTVYMSGPDSGDVQLPIVPVQREILLTEQDTIKFRVKKAVEALIEGPTDQERKDGLSSCMPKDVELLNVEVKRPYVTVDFSSELQYIGGSMMVGSLKKQLAYTLTELDGIAGVIVQVNGEQVGTDANPFTGEGLMFDESPHHALTRPAQGEWMKKISPSRALDNFIVNIGNAKEMWQWMGSGAREYYQSPEKVNVTELSEGLGSWRDYIVISEDMQGNRATVIIKGEQVLEGMVEKDAEYTAYIVKEDGYWKWDPWSKNQ